mmetsp:Transcript_73672/g.204868  ORF Transcript_73672/g.204868 Transcript_73672/m.204868 type:complete len:247 (+) Transcript_73672:2561-3301(+)
MVVDMAVAARERVAIVAAWLREFAPAVSSEGACASRTPPRTSLPGPEANGAAATAGDVVGSIAMGLAVLRTLPSWPFNISSAAGKLFKLSSRPIPPGMHIDSDTSLDLLGLSGTVATLARAVVASAAGPRFCGAKTFTARNEALGVSGDDFGAWSCLCCDCACAADPRAECCPRGVAVAAKDASSISGGPCMPKMLFSMEVLNAFSLQLAESCKLCNSRARNLAPWRVSWPRSFNANRRFSPNAET